MGENEDIDNMVSEFPHSITLKHSAKGETYWEFKLRFKDGTTAEERAKAIKDQDDQIRQAVGQA